MHRVQCRADDVMFQKSGTQDLVSVSIADTIFRGLNNLSQITFLRGKVMIQGLHLAFCVSQPAGYESGARTLEGRNGGTKDMRKWTACLHSDRAARFISSQEHYTAKGRWVGCYVVVLTRMSCLEVS